MRRKFKTSEEAQADQLSKAIRNREAKAKARFVRSERLARERVIREARMDAEIESRAEEIRNRIVKMRTAKISWVADGHGTDQIPKRFVKYVELD